MAYGPYRKKPSQDWANRTSERSGFEAYVKNPERGDYLIDRDVPPPTADQMARRLVRDRALQWWHTHAIPAPFERWFAHGGRHPDDVTKT